MHHPTDRIAHTTAFVTPVMEHWLQREIAQWVYPMKDQSDNSSHHERTLLPRSYISLHDDDDDREIMLVLVRQCHGRVSANSVMGCQINSNAGPTELFLIPASAPQLV